MWFVTKRTTPYTFHPINSLCSYCTALSINFLNISNLACFSFKLIQLSQAHSLYLFWGSASPSQSMPLVGRNWKIHYVWCCKTNFETKRSSFFLCLPPSFSNWAQFFFIKPHGEATKAVTVPDDTAIFIWQRRVPFELGVAGGRFVVGISSYNPKFVGKQNPTAQTWRESHRNLISRRVCWRRLWAEKTNFPHVQLCRIV